MEIIFLFMVLDFRIFFGDSFIIKNDFYKKVIKGL